MSQNIWDTSGAMVIGTEIQVFRIGVIVVQFEFISHMTDPHFGVD
jgi:hypothetical protein